ncbi:MAG: ATP-binding protein [Anaerolineae bacterium]|jgi:PAS domain S-box-containing protein
MSDQIQDRDRRLAGVFQQISQALVSNLELRDLLGVVVDQAIATLDADVAILRLLDRPGEYLDVKVARGVPEEVVRQVRFRPGEGLAGRLLLYGTPLRGVNLQQDPRASQRALAHRLGWQSFAAAALHLNGEPIGVWFVMRTRREPFTDDEMSLLSAFADYASLAVEKGWLLNTIVREKHESETLLQASANGILVVDGRGRVIDMNPALERLTGWTLSQARGEPCCDVVGCQVGQTPEAPELAACPLQVGMTGKNRAFLEYQLRSHDGQSIPVEASYGLIRDEDGETERIIMVFRDLSRQKTLDRMRAEIVANVSHELRTPLALIKGYAATLLSPQVSLDEAETRRFLTNVSFAADRLGRMIDDLLCASRLETEQLRLQPRTFDLGQEVQQVVAWFQPHAQGCRLVSRLPVGTLQVWADPDRVEQVLVNLLTNAAKYSASESTITVQCQVLDDPPRVAVHVSDEGIGIAPEHLPRIFDRFYLTETSEKGVGLGLYICHALVEAMGGKIWVVSEVGKGSTFSFTLPADDGGSESATPEA